MTGRSRPWATGLLVALCTGLGAVVAYELTGGLEIAPEVTAAAAPTSKIEWRHEPIVFQAPAREQFAEITARPLFSPERRPFEPPTEAAPEAEAPVMVQPLELVGVLLTEQRSAALVQAVGGNDPSWVREGEQAQGWEIEKIEQDRVHLRSGESVEVVELRPDTAVPPEARPKKRRQKRERREDADQEQDQAAESSEETALPDTDPGDDDVYADPSD